MTKSLSTFIVVVVQATAMLYLQPAAVVDKSKQEVASEAFDPKTPAECGQLIQRDFDSVQQLLSDQARSTQLAERFKAMRRVLAERREVLDELVVLGRRQYVEGKRSIDSLLALMSKRLNVELDLSATQAERSTALGNQVSSLTDLEKIAQNDTRPRTDYLSAKAARLSVESDRELERYGRRNSDKEIEALKNRAEALGRRVRDIAKLYSAGASGGDPGRIGEFGCAWWMSLADLALAEGDKPRAEACLKSALQYRRWSAAALVKEFNGNPAKTMRSIAKSNELEAQILGWHRNKRHR